jgi:hypothetical protein
MLAALVPKQMFPRRTAALVCAIAVAWLPACRRGAVAQEMAKPPDVEEATGQAKCGVRKSAAKPLVVEWPAAERAALESGASRGLVAVRYEGCDMEILTTCTASGSYGYVGLTQKREGVRIRSADELYAELPVGAAGLEAKLERAGQLNVDMVIVGRKEADKTVFNERDLTGRCDDATHVITGLTVGAFSFYTGASAEVGGAVRVGNMGVGAGSSAGNEVLREDGSGESCVVASTADVSPPEGCGALLRVEVVPIDRIFAQSTPTSPTGMAGTTPTDTTPTTTDPALDKKIRNNSIMLISGYGAFLVGSGLGAAGYVLWTRNKGKLSMTDPDVVEPDRQSTKSKATTGAALGWTGIGVAVAGLALALWASARAGKLRQQKAMRATVEPFGAPGVAGLGVRGRF